MSRRIGAGFTRVATKGPEAVTDHSLYIEALATLPDITTWAVAAQAEFRAVQRHNFDAPLRGVLHHDGAILRFTTWGRVERFVSSPMEFEWSVHDRELRIDGRQTARFFDFAPLERFVSEPPAFAQPASSAKDNPFFGLVPWLDSWT